MRKAILYYTDLTDDQWNLLQAVLPSNSARRGPGRPRTDLRLVCNALLYHVRSGCAWRLLPKDFGPWQTIYDYFWRWTQQGRWKIINDLLRDAIRRSVGKRVRPTAAVLDSQSVRSADVAGARGFDAGKKIKGIKRHILVDALGLLLWVCVTPADVSERKAARGFLSQALGCFGWLRCLWADPGYAGKAFAAWVAQHRKTGTLRLEVIARLSQQRGFGVVAKRWIVERTFGWFMKHRRLVRNYEVKQQHAEAWLYVAMIGIMLRRLA